MWNFYYQNKNVEFNLIKGGFNDIDILMCVALPHIRTHYHGITYIDILTWCAFAFGKLFFKDSYKCGIQTTPHKSQGKTICNSFIAPTESLVPWSAIAKYDILIKSGFTIVFCCGICS